MRWLRGRERAPAIDDASLAPIRIFTPEIELTGFVAPTGQRITDLLLRGQDLAFLPAGAAPRPENWVLVAAADVLFVVPPPLSPARRHHDARGTFPVGVVIGPYRIRGAAHAPSEGASGHGAFLPLTGATIQRDGAVEEPVDVVIVNMAAAGPLEPPGNQI